jgi:AAA domain-containing protein/DnaB helicase-like protein
MSAPARIPPHNLDAERAVVGALIVEPETHTLVLASLAVDDLYLQAHRDIYTAIRALVGRGDPVSAITVSDELRRAAVFDTVGGAATIALLNEHATIPAYVSKYVAIVKDAANLRRAEQAAMTILSAAAEPNATFDAVAPVIRDLERLRDGAHDGAGPAYVVECMADVKSEKVEWLWEGRVAVGKINLLVGIPGLGKSMVTLDIVSRVTTGREMPDGGPSASVGNVIVLSAEDASADTIKPRLEAHGADCSRVYRLRAVRDARGEHEFSIRRDLRNLESLIAEKQARLVVIDPLSAYLGGDSQSWSDSAMRALLSPLAAMAERSRVAVWGVMHLTKDADRLAIHRVPGSIAFAAAARVITAVVEDPEDEDRRILGHVKNNLGRRAEAVAFDLKGGSVAWSKEPVAAFNVNAALAAPPEYPFALRQAIAFLESVFEGKADGELVPSKDIEQSAAEAGISKATLLRAKNRLGIDKRRVGGSDGAWHWAKKSTTAPADAAPGAPVSSVSLVSLISSDGTDAKKSNKSKKPKKSPDGVPVVAVVDAARTGDPA